jgi:hypothetical protein
MACLWDQSVLVSSYESRRDKQWVALHFTLHMLGANGLHIPGKGAQRYEFSVRNAKR